jgi:hypothetical protein
MRYCSRCNRETRHWREDLLPLPRDFRWFALLPIAVLVNALAGRWKCRECAGDENGDQQAHRGD